MRTIVDIPEKQLAFLDAMCAQEQISRAEAVRRAVELLLAQQIKSDTIQEVFGMWKYREDVDGVTYQRALRDEWS